MPPFFFHSLYTKLALTNSSFPSSSPSRSHPSLPSSPTSPTTSKSPTSPSTNSKPTITLSPHLALPLPYVPYRPSFPPSLSSGPATPSPHTILSPSSNNNKATLGLGGISAYMRGSTGGNTNMGSAVPVPPAMTMVGTARTASATPPLVSRPVSLGVFSGGSGSGGREAVMGRGRTVQHRQEFEREYEREYARSESGAGGETYGYGRDGGDGRGHERGRVRGGGGGGGAYDEPSYSPGYGAYGYGNTHTYGYDQHRGDGYEYGYGYGGRDARGEHRRVSAPTSASGARTGGGMRGARGVDDFSRLERERDAREKEMREAREKQTREKERAREREKERRANANRVVWAKWDLVDDRRILTLAYPSSLQIWDTSNLKSIKEVLNVHFDNNEWALIFGIAGGGGEGEGVTKLRQRGKGGVVDVRVVDARVLPRRLRERRGGGGGEKDRFEDVRPVLGILLETTEERYISDEGFPETEIEKKTFFVVYSLRTHEVVKLLVVDGRGESFGVSGDVIVLSTSNPPTLHVLSASTFEVVYVVPSSALEAFVHPPAHPSPSPAANVLSPSLSLSTGVVGSASPSASGISLSIANAITNTLSSAAGLGRNISSQNQSERGSPDHQRAFPSLEVYPRPVFALSGRLLAYASPSSGGSSSGSSPVDGNGNTSSPTPSSLLSNLSRGVGSRMSMGLGMTRRLSSSSSTSGVSGLSAGGGGGGGGNGGSSVSSSSFGSGGLGKMTGLTMTKTQADVGQAALRVGESMVSGMKFLGGMAYEAARSRVGGVGGSGSGSGSRERERERERGRRMVSRSVPDTPDVDEAAARMLRERRYSNMSAVSASPSISGSGNAQTTTTTTTVVTPHTKTSAEHGHYVTVIDLAPLFNDMTAPRKIDEFNASRSQPVAGLRFAQDGTSVGVITRDGHSVKVFKLFPAPSIVTSLQSSSVSPSQQSNVNVIDEQETEAALDRLRLHRPASQTYDLYRGRTSAVVEDVVWARDGRWVALGTRNRTVHIFATNPYGGKSDLRSHLEGRVRGVDVIEHPLTGLTALAKLRASNAHGQINAPLAFTFISPSDVLSSPDLVPPRSPPAAISSHAHQHPSSPSSPKIPASSSTSGNASSTTTISKHGKKAKNFQDILLFDPATGVLSLRRLTLEKRPVREGVVAAAATALGSGASRTGTSISLPGMGGVGRLSSSPSSSSSRMGGGVVGIRGGEERHQYQQEEVQMELWAKESVMATWDLRRASDRAEIRVPLDVRPRSNAGPGGGSGKRDWLAQGEITTSSPSHLVLPRSLYLSHQFTFWTLGEDYHALIRRYQLDMVPGVSGRRVEVRMGVEISGGYGVGSPQAGSANEGNAGGISVSIPGGRSLDIGDRDEGAFVEDFPSSPHPHPHPHSHSRSLSHSHSLSHPHSHSHSIQRVSSSFDEPIASAISGTFFDGFDDPNNVLLPSHSHLTHLHSPMAMTLPPILPMYPNGVPGIVGPTSKKAVAAAASIRNAISNAIPIRARGIGEGMSVSGSVARLRFKGVGSKRERDRGDVEGQGGVPLEFDEEDEDFVGTGANPSVEASTATIIPLRSGQPSHQALQTQDANPNNPNVELDHEYLEGGDVVGSVDEELWGDGGWDNQDREAVEEQEGFWDLVGGGGMGGVRSGGGTGIGGNMGGVGGGSRLLAESGTDEKAGVVTGEGNGAGVPSSSASASKGTKKSGKQKRRA